MTTQAKNHILAVIVLGMLTIAGLAGYSPAEPTGTVTILIPKDQPIQATIAAAPEIDQDEFECMRANLYHEAGNQDRRGMEAVALVTLNRTHTKHYPPTICEVVKAKAKTKRGRWVCQFSWYCDKKSDEPKLTMTVRINGKKVVVPNIEERKAWNLATAVATDAMNGKVKDFLGRATHYHADYVKPDWSRPVNAKRYHYLTRIGDHLFYRDVKLGLKAS